MIFNEFPHNTMINKHLLEGTDDMLDCLAIIISICTLAFSIWQFYLERIRNRKEATIHAFDDLENNNSFRLLLSLSKSKIDEYVARKKEYGKQPEG